MRAAFDAPLLASLTDTLMQLIVVLLLMAVCVAIVIVWLVMRRWGPALKHLTNVVEREIHQVERTANAISQSANAQAKHLYRQGASVRGAIEGVRSLHSLVLDLDQHADDLRKLARQMESSSSIDGASLTLAQHAVSSADQLMHTAKRAQQTYRKLLTSVQELAEDASALRETGQEAERNAVLLTGAMERVRVAVHEPRHAEPAARRHAREDRDDWQDHPARAARGESRRFASDDRRASDPRRASRSERESSGEWDPERDEPEQRRPRAGLDGASAALEDPRPAPRSRSNAYDDPPPRDDDPSDRYRAAWDRDARPRASPDGHRRRPGSHSDWMR
jgi:uncharacterized protein YoxC